MKLKKKATTTHYKTYNDDDVKGIPQIFLNANESVDSIVELGGI